jgi:hypothetical protein
MDQCEWLLIYQQSWLLQVVGAMLASLLFQRSDKAGSYIAQ